MRRQRLNVYRMELMGARVVPVTSGTRTLKDATNEAMRDWVTNVTDTHYIIGSVVGPDPFPRMVRDFQAVIGREARAQMLERYGRLPRTVVACVGGGSNAIGIFSAFLDDAAVELVGVEAAGEGIETGRHAASLSQGRPGVFHGSRSYLLQDADGQVQPAHSISAGLDYPGVGPEHAFLKDSGRVLYETVTDRQALEAFSALARLEGIVPALESAHAVAWVRQAGRRWTAGRSGAHQPERPGRQGRRHGRRPGASGSPMSDAPSTELALPPAQVEELLSLIGKALRAVQLYLPNNPVYQRALENVRVACRKLWQATDDLVLDVQETELRWEGNVVYQPRPEEREHRLDAVQGRRAVGHVATGRGGHRARALHAGAASGAHAPGGCGRRSADAAVAGGLPDPLLYVPGAIQLDAGSPDRGRGADQHPIAQRRAAAGPSRKCRRSGKSCRSTSSTPRSTSSRIRRSPTCRARWSGNTRRTCDTTCCRCCSICSSSRPTARSGPS